MPKFIKIYVTAITFIGSSLTVRSGEFNIFNHVLCTDESYLIIDIQERLFDSMVCYLHVN